MQKTISEIIKFRLDQAGKRYYSCDNISDVLLWGDKEQIIEQAAFAYEKFLDALIIDRENDANAKDTGKRVAKMFVNELLAGRYTPEPDATSFPNEGLDFYKGMLVTRVAIHSICSHHHQPVVGTCWIGVIPGTKVIGLSKYSRIAQHAARRGTLQEELTVRIANRIKDLTGSEDVAVYIEASHGCCSNRGIMAPDSTTQTCVVHGQFHDGSVKSEFFDQIKLQRKL